MIVTIDIEQDLAAIIAELHERADVEIALDRSVWSDQERAALEPPPDITVSEYADQYRVLQAGVSRNPGRWSTDYTPYLRDPMDAYKLPYLRHLVLCFATQLGKTEALYNILQYIIGHDPYSTLLMYPREDDARSVSRTRVQPMIDDCADLRAKKPARADLYQALEMHFPGMILYLAGANSLAALAQKPCRNILRDEIDKYPPRLGKDADPLSKSEERAKSYWGIRKIVDVSSPTFSDVGILKQLARCNVVFRIQHPCPHCGRYQELEFFKGVKFDNRPDDPDAIMIAKRSAVYVCRHCGSEITNDHRPWMIEHYRYMPDRELDYDPERVGFWASSLSSPMLSWGDIAEAFLEAVRDRDDTGDTTKLQNFINDWLALPYEHTVKKSSEDAILARRCDLPPGTVPEQAVALTCGIDVQKHGFWYSVWAWTNDFESWLIDYGFLPEWEDVGNLVFEQSYPVQDSRDRMRIWRAAMDTGGGADSKWGDEWTKTEEIVTWIRDNGRGVVHGVKGMSRESGQKIRHSVLDKMPGRGGPIPGGMVLWLLDTTQLKDTLFWRLSNADDEPQPLHLHAETGKGFATHLLAEEKQRDKNGKWRYVQVHRENHLLDTCVYAHAAADFQWLGGVKILTGRVGTARLVMAGDDGGAIPAAARPLPRPGSITRPRPSQQFKRPSWLGRR